MNELEKRLIGLGDKIENKSHGWDWYFHKRRNNPFDVDWGDLELNYNSAPYNSDTCFVLTSYWRHLRFLKASLMGYRLTGKFVVCGYDNPFKAWELDKPDTDMKFFMPRREHFQLAHSFVFKHPTYGDNKRFGSFWDMKYGQAIANAFKFKYVFLGTTDCVFDKPEGVDKIIEILGDGDLMSVSSSSAPGGHTGSVHSNSVIFKIKAFNKVMEYMTSHFEVPVIGHGCANTDSMLSEAVVCYKLKETIAPKQPIYPKDGSVDHYCCYGQPSTWKDVLGFHNLFAEWITASEECLEPPDKKYIDDFGDYCYFDEGPESPIAKYYKTGDRRFLYRWWDVYKLPEETRKDKPIESYGDTPIYKEK